MSLFTRKTWKDRITEYPTRRTLTKADGSAETVTVARSEGTVSQEGDAFSAANMNDLENRIGVGFEEVNNNLVPIQELQISDYTLNDLLSVDITNRNDVLHETVYFGTDDASTLVNSPVTTGQFYGYRTVAFMKRADDSLWLLKVTIHELIPNWGRCWANVYSTGNNTWYGWKEAGADAGVPFRQTLNGLTGHSNHANKGHVSLTLITMPYSGSFSVGIYGTDNPNEVSHGANVTNLGAFTISSSQVGKTQIIDTGTTYKYIVMYPIYQSGWTSGNGCLCEIKIY